ALTYKLGASVLGTLTYSYDQVGNRTTIGGTWARTILPQPASAVVDAADQLAQWSSVALTFDANGNLASDGLNSYSWNARNQLSSISGGLNASFQYDGVGRRVSRSSQSGVTAFLYDSTDILEELNGGIPVSSSLLGLGIDERFSRSDSNSARYPLVDALGSTVALTDAVGSVATSYSYDVFGGAIAFGGADTNP